MTNPTAMEAVPQLVSLLAPLSPEERRRAIKASLAILGDDGTTAAALSSADEATNQSGQIPIPPRAQSWMRQNGLSWAQIQQVFHIADGAVEVIAPEIPGGSDKEKTYVAYVLLGLARLLESGNPFFDDKGARALCESLGCYNGINHSTYLKEKRSEFTGSKDKGWMLTAPGLKRGATLVKELSKEE